jgi:hypothetical protein
MPVDEITQDLIEYTEKIAQKMGQSAVCLSLFTDNYKKSPESLLQFAVAIMQDKPIYLLVRQGTEIPEKVRRVADGIEYFDSLDADSMIDASQNVVKKWQQDQRTKKRG